MDNNNYNDNDFYSYGQSRNVSSSAENTAESSGQESSYNSQSSQNSYSSQTNTGSVLSTGYNTQTDSGSGQQAGAGSYGSGYGSSHQQNSYNSGYQQNSGYQGNAYQGNSGYQNLNQMPYGGNDKKKKEKKQGGFGVKVAKCAALALVFGAVSGTVFEGIHYIGNRVEGEATVPIAEGSDSVLSVADSETKVQAAATATNYVATDVSDIVDATMPSIVAITNVSQTEYQSFWGGMPQTYESTSCGSGIIVSQDSEYLYIVTNNHVVESATSLTVTFNDESTVSAEVKGTDPSTDLAVIKVLLNSIESDTMNSIKVATMGSSDDLRVGEAAIAIGNALGYGQSVTTGCISALDREVSISDNNTNYTAALIQTDAAINPGNSGGALLNAAGEVIGINSVKYSDTDVEGIGYAIPISTAIPIIEDLITKEKVDESESAYLGVAGVDVTNDVAKNYNMPSGVYVAQVTSGSGAELAGIQKGDIITEFDGRTIDSMEELASTIEYYKAGTTVDVTIMRASNGEYVEQVLSVTLGKKN